MAFIDPCSDRHEFDRVHAQHFEVLDDGGFSKSCDGAAFGVGHIGVAHGETTHIQFINQLGFSGGSQWQRLCRLYSNGFWNQMRSFVAVAREFCCIFKGAGDSFGERIQQQFVSVEVMTRRWVVGAVGSKTIVLPFGDSLNERVMNIAIALCEFVMPELFVVAIEQHDINMRGRMRPDRDVGTAVSQSQAKRKGLGLGIADMETQVITVGAVRPVLTSMPAVLRAKAIMVLRASCGSA